MKNMSVQAAMLLIVVVVSGCTTYPTPENPMVIRPPVHREPLPVMPEEGYTWQQLVDIVLTANHDYAAILAQARAEYYRYKSRTDLNDLRLSLEYFYLSDDDDRRRNQYEAAIRFPIPNPFINKHIILTGEAARRETEFNAEVFKNELSSMIYELVQEILIGERELSILLLREQVLSDWAELLEMRFNARMTTQTDMRTLDFQRLRMTTAVRQAQLRIQAARRSLLILVRIPDEQLILKPAYSDWETVLAEFTDDMVIIENAFSRSAELAAANAVYEQACAMFDTARAQQIPWFDSFRLSYTLGMTENFNYRKSDEWAVELSVNLPVFAWFKNSEKERAAAEVEAASLRINGIRQRIHTEITGIIADLQDNVLLLTDYQTTFNAIPQPTRESIPDPESYYKLLDSWLSASEYVLKTELQCALIYSQLLKISGGWEQDFF